MSSVDDTLIDKAKLEKSLMEIKQQLEKAFNDNTELKNKLKENEKQITSLEEEKEAIQLKLDQNYPNKKVHLNPSNHNNETNSSYSAKESIQNTKQDKIEEEDNSISMINTTANSCKEAHDKNPSNSSSQSSNNASNFLTLVKEDEDEDEEGQVVVDFVNTEIFKSFDELKIFFKKTWDFGCSGVELEQVDPKTSNQEKVAHMKMYIFRMGHYIDFYDKNIENALIHANFGEMSTTDELVSALEDLFETILTRSKVLELYEECGKEAGLYYKQRKKVSLLQIQSRNTQFYKRAILSLLDYQKCETWSYERVKAVCEFWQSGVVSRYQPEYKSRVDSFSVIYNALFKSLEKNISLENYQKESLLSILQITKKYCKK